MHKTHKIKGGEVLLKDLTFSYPGGIDALCGVSFEMAAGERVALIGPNGAGKSTLFLCMLDLAEKYSGEIIIDGINLADKKKGSELHRKIGLVFQDTEDQMFNPTVLEDVVFGPLNIGMSKEEALKCSKQALESVGLTEQYFTRPPHNLSGGQKRRAAIAGILAMDPTVLLLDEPTSDLDPRGRKRLAKLLNGLPQTMLIATHDLEFVLKTCQKVILLDGGKIVASGPSKEIMSDKELMEKHGLEKPHSLVAHQHTH